MKASHVQNLESIRSDNGLFLSLASTRSSFELALRMVCGVCMLDFDLGIGMRVKVKRNEPKRVRKGKKATRDLKKMFLCL